MRNAPHRRALHTLGDAEKWWKECQIDPIAPAEYLWRQRLDRVLMRSVAARAPIMPGPDWADRTVIRGSARLLRSAPQLLLVPAPGVGDPGLR